MTADSAVAWEAWLQSVEGGGANGELTIHSAGKSSLGVEGGLPMGVAKADEVQLGVCEGVEVSLSEGEGRRVRMGGGGGGTVNASCSVSFRGNTLGCQGNTTLCTCEASSGSA